jgi:hypothetical protein
MQYTVYHLHKKAHNIRSPSQQLLLPTHVAYSHLRNWPTTVAFVESCNFHFLKIYDLTF